MVTPKKSDIKAACTKLRESAETAIESAATQRLGNAFGPVGSPHQQQPNGNAREAQGRQLPAWIDPAKRAIEANRLRKGKHDE